MSMYTSFKNRYLINSYIFFKVIRISDSDFIVSSAYITAASWTLCLVWSWLYQDVQKHLKICNTFFVCPYYCSECESTWCLVSLLFGMESSELYWIFYSDYIEPAQIYREYWVTLFALLNLILMLDICGTFFKLFLHQINICHIFIGKLWENRNTSLKK